MGLRVEPEKVPENPRRHHLPSTHPIERSLQELGHLNPWIPGGWAVPGCALVQRKCYSRWGPGDSFWAEGLGWVLGSATSMGQTFLAMTLFAPSW